MAKKISRTGKKKKTQYGPGSQQSRPQITVSTEEQQRLRTGRRYNWIAVGLLLLAMIGILFSPRFGYGTFYYNAVSVVAYILTIAAGGIMLYSVKYAAESRRTTGKVTGVVMMFVGVFGIVNTLFLSGLISN